MVNTRFEVIPTGQPGIWRNAQNYVFKIDAEGFGMWVLVPRDFECDLASVPRSLRWLFPPHKIAQAALVHDWLYANPDVPRVIADAVFAAVMKANGVCWAVRGVAYVAVRLFGWRHKK